ncbi:hypothetical protein COLO4_25970 [Corchorus olitorius]|uniref:Uncharacterized protein n=1 Tax=Corchorus olitorius TaxID=93759 RepID=A0A1R3HZ70_9ROSI|nr:hypothetical protein COLO4_25970 [Corchorus olitorius]
MASKLFKELIPTIIYGIAYPSSKIIMGYLPLIFMENLNQISSKYHEPNAFLVLFFVSILIFMFLSYIFGNKLGSALAELIIGLNILLSTCYMLMFLTVSGLIYKKLIASMVLPLGIIITKCVLLDKIIPFVYVASILKVKDRVEINGEEHVLEEMHLGYTLYRNNNSNGRRRGQILKQDNLIMSSGFIVIYRDNLRS